MGLRVFIFIMALFAITVIQSGPAFACYVNSDGDYICESKQSSKDRGSSANVSNRPANPPTPKYQPGGNLPWQGLPEYFDLFIPYNKRIYEREIYLPDPRFNPPPGRQPTQPIEGCEDCDPNRPVDDSTYEEFKRHLLAREGYRNCVYLDSEGYPTVGVGHLVRPSDNLKVGDCISDERVQQFLDQDARQAYSAALAQAQQAGQYNHCFVIALGSVNFQLGTGWRSKFQRRWNQMQQGDFCGAADGLENTLWGQQTPVRVKDFQCALQKAGNCSGESTPGECGDPDSGWSNEECCRALAHVQAGGTRHPSGATSGYCAYGTRRLLQHMGKPGPSGGAGDAWQYQSQMQGWGYSNNPDCPPDQAPNGSVLIYDRNNPPGASGGARYGHIEVKCTCNGTTWYLSDYASTRPGGSVPGNHIGTWTQ